MEKKRAGRSEILKACRILSAVHNGEGYPVAPKDVRKSHYWLKFEDLCSDPKSVATDLLAFVGGKPEFLKINEFCNKIDASRDIAQKIERNTYMYSSEFATPGYSLSNR